MPTITITLTIDVPDGVEVAVASTATQIADAVIPRLRDSVEELLPSDQHGGRRWTRGEALVAEDIALSDEDVAERIGRTWGAVHAYRLKNGIVAPTKGRNVDTSVERAMRRWTKAEADMLAEYIPTCTPEEVASALGRTVPAVRREAQRLTLISSQREWPRGKVGPQLLLPED